jgi:mono/diheme cytochrome c family protein
LSLWIAVGLAKTDAGAADLLDLAAAGRVRRTLLRHRYVELAFEKRPAALRARAATLTQNLPPEDARIDAVIAQRVGAAGNFKADAGRGAPLFATHCATCHRFREQGGNIGPSLDGIGSRLLGRLIEDILDPSRNIDPAFQLTSVTLKNVRLNGASPTLPPISCTAMPGSP